MLVNTKSPLPFKGLWKVKLSWMAWILHIALFLCIHFYVLLAFVHNRSNALHSYEQMLTKQKIAYIQK